MSKEDKDKIRKLEEDCLALEEQVKLLVKTELKLRRTQAELVQSKEIIQEYSRTLEQKVEERTKELIDINTKLRQEMIEHEKAEIEKKKLEDNLRNAEKIEAVGILAGSVAHDLNNILSGIVNYPELLLCQIEDDSPLRKSIIAMRESGLKAAAVVQDLLTLARRGVVNKEIINLNEIIEKILKSPEFLRLDHFDLKIDLDKDLRNMYGSEIHISNAVMNLIYNSYDAIKDKGKLLIKTKNKYIEKPKGRLINKGNYVLVEISDTGIGISRKDLKRIFEPFYTKKVMGKSGTGLGMAIVWGTVMDHNGYIDVKSKLNVGSTFTLYFPATEHYNTPKIKSVKCENCRGNGETILVIDDVELQRDICTKILESIGYNVKAVSSGEEAVRYLKNNEADLLILDMIMDPGMNGYETYKEILKIHPGQKAVISSGFSETDLVKQTRALGAGAYIKKPYTIETLGLVVRDELNKS